MRSKTDLRPAEPKPLPRCQPLGCVEVNFVKVYVRDAKRMLKAHHENGGCELFIDLEDSGRVEGLELHLGVAGNFQSEPLRSSRVKNHIDIYIPTSEIHAFLQAIIQANLRRSGPGAKDRDSFLGSSLASSCNLPPARASSEKG